METKEIISEYLSGRGLEEIAKANCVGKLKIKGILAENGIPIRGRGGVKIDSQYKISDWKVEKYPIIDGIHYVAIFKEDGKRFSDYMNQGGYLTSYIAQRKNIKIPSLYDRRKYYMTTGDYWWEQWFDIIPELNKEIKKCPYCNWETIDVANKSGAFEQHLQDTHNISKKEYLKEFPDDIQYFRLKNGTLDLEFEKDDSKFIVCQECGRKFSRIDSRHLRTHNMTKWDYIKKYNSPTYSISYLDIMHKNALHMNESLDGNNAVFTSKYEQELFDYISSLGFKCHKNRSILKGKELDIYIPEKKIAIEFNGNKYHTEIFGNKDRQYHLDKTIRCEAAGVRLIQIFEDEYVLHKDIVKSKISHILGTNTDLATIYARKCAVSPIDNNTAKNFLEKYHIQGYAKSTIYLGAYFNDVLVGVMSFTKNRDNNWELTRFASDYHFNYAGLGGKLLKYFIRNYNPSQIKSFADRRWVDSKSNIYNTLGFTFVKNLPPDYRYYNESIDRLKRFHKFGFRKQYLHKTFDLPLSLTETEMTQRLGYDRIWDCGLAKYIWKKDF